MREAPAGAKSLVDLFQDELLRVRFEPPEGYDEMVFWPLGLSEKEDKPLADVDRVLVISPFLSDGFLSRLASEGKDHVLVSRLSSLQALMPTTRQRFKSLRVLREGAEGEQVEGDVQDAVPSLDGLHAKVYVADWGWNASIFSGSANATDAGHSRNVEFLVELRGKKSKCGVEAILSSRDGETSLSSLLEEVKIVESTPADPIRQELDALLQQARRAVWEAHLELAVHQEPNDSFRVALRQTKPLLLPDSTNLVCWPITLRDEAAQKVVSGGDLSFGPLSFEALTSFLAFELTVSAKDQTDRCHFVLNLPMTGAPADRRERLLRSLLRDREQVMRLLLLLLSDGGIDVLGLLTPAGWTRAAGAGTAIARHTCSSR